MEILKLLLGVVFLSASALWSAYNISMYRAAPWDRVWIVRVRKWKMISSLITLLLAVYVYYTVSVPTDLGSV